MKRKLFWLLGAGLVTLGLSFPTAVHSQEASPSKSAEKPKPATVKVEQGKLVVEMTLKGIVESEQTSELSLNAKSWTGPFTVKSAAPHGTRVKKGDIVLELDTVKIDQALRDLRLERELADIGVRQLKEELPVLEKFLPLNLAAAERDKRIAEEDFKRYSEIEREQTKKQSEFMLKSQTHYLDYAREELKQLEKMYRDKDLTEETEEIILKRQRNQIEQIEFNIASQKLRQDRELNVDLPRRDRIMQEAVEKQSLAWQKAQSSLRLELEQKRLSLQKLEAELAKSYERYGHLETDRAAMVVQAPSDGFVFHGQADRGQWNTAMITSRLRPNGALQPNEIFMTIVAPRPVAIRADVEEKDLHAFKELPRGEATPVGFPKLKLPAQLKSVSLIPRAAGSFEARISLDLPDSAADVMPGMAATVKFITYRNDTALLAPTSAIFRDEGSEASYVLVAGEGEPTKTEVQIGNASGGKTEILSGLKAGTEILAAKPQ